MHVDHVSAVKFDLDRLRGCHVNPAEFDNEDSDVNDLIKYNPEISMKVSPPKHWELDVKGLVSTEKWLQNYGLKRNRLDMFHLLPTLGFKHSDGKYVDYLCRHNSVDNPLNRIDGR